MNYNDKTQQCKGCGKNIPFGNYHKKCYKSRMGTSSYIDDKMDLSTYPVSYEMPGKDRPIEDQYRDLYKALGTIDAKKWIAENVTKDINMEEVFHQIMEGDLEYAE